MTSSWVLLLHSLHVNAKDALNAKGGAWCWVQVEHELLHLLVLLDVKRSAAAGGDKPAAPATPTLDGQPPVLRCTVVDAGGCRACARAAAPCQPPPCHTVRPAVFAAAAQLVTAAAPVWGLAYELAGMHC